MKTLIGCLVTALGLFVAVLGVLAVRSDQSGSVQVANVAGVAVGDGLDFSRTQYEHSIVVAEPIVSIVDAARSVHQELSAQMSGLPIPESE